MGYDDVKKMWLQHELILKRFANYGDIFYVDATNGDDDNNGEYPNYPFASLEKAIDTVEDSHNDIIIHKGYELVTAGITVDKEKTSIFGWGLFGANKYYPEIGCLHRVAAEDAPVLTIDADFVEIAGLACVAEWVVDGVAYQPAMRVANGANKAHIHHCYFPDWGVASQTVGLTVHGAHFTVVEDCTFHSVYGNIDWGLYFASSPSNPAYTKVKRCSFLGGSGAMTNGLGTEVGLATHQYWEFEALRFLNVTYGILLGTEVAVYGTVKDVVGTMAGANIFESSDGDDDTLAHVADWSVSAGDCHGSDGPLVA